MCTINKLPNVKSDLVRTDEDCEEWKIENLVDSLQKWLRGNRTEEDKSTGDPRREKNLFARNGGKENERGKKTLCCMFCKAEHWSEMCKSYVTTAQRKAYFGENNLCFNSVVRDIGLDIVGVVGAITVGRNTIPVYMIRKRRKVMAQY